MYSTYSRFPHPLARCAELLGSNLDAHCKQIIKRVHRVLGPDKALCITDLIVEYVFPSFPCLLAIPQEETLQEVWHLRD